MSEIDTIYSQQQRHVVDFAFDETVAKVFADMIRRSVPGYEAILSLLSVIGSRYIKDHSKVYDIGCSLGAGLAALTAQVNLKSVQYIAVDTSSQMLEKARTNLLDFVPKEQLLLLNQRVQDLCIKDASLVLMNFTLQFVEPDDRMDVMGKIYQGLNPGGVLVLSEKWHHDSSNVDQLLTELHHQFKALNGYSDLEISQKRTAIENVMITDSREKQEQRLKKIGFQTVFPWFQCLNFGSLIAIK